MMPEPSSRARARITSTRVSMSLSLSVVYGGRGATGRNRGAHVAKPGLALRLASAEAEVAHAQTRVPALLAVGVWSAPVLDQKQGQVPSWWPEVLGIQAAQQRVLLNARVEA